MSLLSEEDLTVKALRLEHKYAKFCLIKVYLSRVRDMSMAKTIQEKRDEILRIAHRYGVKNVRVFGSVARGDDRAESDIDFLVDLEIGRTLFDLGGFLTEAEQLLGRKIDVVTDQALHSYIREQVLQEAVSL